MRADEDRERRNRHCGSGMSTYARIAELAAKLEKPLDEPLRRLRDELIALIESGRHIVIGARATMFYTQPRYTADVDYAVGRREFLRVRKWFKQSEADFQDNGEAIECPALRVDVIDASRNAVMKAVLARHTGIPSLEAVATLKYVAAISSTRPYERRQQDSADLAVLVLRPGFDDQAFLTLLVGPYQEEIERARTVLADIKAHRRITLEHRSGDQSMPQRTSRWKLRGGACCLAACVAWATPLLALAGPPVTGSLETVHGIRVLRVWGTPEERGHAHGRLLGAELLDLFDNVVLSEHILKQPGDYESVVQAKLLPQLRFAPEERAELEGMLRGITEAVGPDKMRRERLNRNFEVRDLLAINSMADWYPFACSSFSAWGPATEGGEMITVRNLDFLALPPLATQQVLIAYVDPGDGKNPWVTMAWPGLIGAYSAMNAEGVTVSMHDAEPLQPASTDSFVPRSLALRKAVEAAGATTALDDVRRVLSSSPSMMGNNIHFSAPFSGQPNPAGVFEYDGNLSRDGGATLRTSTAEPNPCWVACTNHYCVRRVAPQAGDSPFDSVRRFGSISESLAGSLASGGKVDLEMARKVLANVAADGNVATLHSVYYFPNRRELYVSLGTPGVPAPATPPVRLKLADLLRKPT